MLRMKHVIAIVFILTGLKGLGAQPCDTPECRQFDFWIGEWELSWTDKEGQPVTGKNSISAILDSLCDPGEFFRSIFPGDECIGI